jgi:hypothetical protein
MPVVVDWRASIQVDAVVALTQDRKLMASSRFIWRGALDPRPSDLLPQVSRWVLSEPAKAAHRKDHEQTGQNPDGRCHQP